MPRNVKSRAKAKAPKARAPNVKVLKAKVSKANNKLRAPTLEESLLEDLHRPPMAVKFGDHTHYYCSPWDRMACSLTILPTDRIQPTNKGLKIDFIGSTTLSLIAPGLEFIVTVNLWCIETMT
jgi:hypothetical protein